MPVRKSQQSQPGEQGRAQPDVPEQERLVEQAEERILEQVFSIGLHHLLPLRVTSAAGRARARGSTSRRRGASADRPAGR